MTAKAPQVGNFIFHQFNNPFSNRVMDPNTWTIERANGCASICTADGALIDDPTDTGQSDLSLIFHGIGWLHCSLRDPYDNSL